MRDPGEWGSNCAPLKAAELGEFSSLSGAQTGATGTVGLLGDACPVFRLLSMVRTVFLLLGQMDGWVGGEGQASSGSR